MIAWLVLAAGCAPEPEPFTVTLAFPNEGDEVFTETPVRIGFSEEPDRESCAAAIALVALGDDEQVAWFSPIEVVDGDGSNSFEIRHDPLIAGVDHALVVQSGSTGCTSALGAPLHPFSVVFHVVDRP